MSIRPKYFQVRQNVPRVSYVSLLDIWMLVCMIFVFACILEFIVITVYIRSGKKMLGEKVKFESEKGQDRAGQYVSKVPSRKGQLRQVFF